MDAFDRWFADNQHAIPPGRYAFVRQTAIDMLRTAFQAGQSVKDNGKAQETNMDDRFYFIRSRYETVTCVYCGAQITIDLDATEGTPPVSDPLDHEEDCHRAEDANPQERIAFGLEG